MIGTPKSLGGSSSNPGHRLGIRCCLFPSACPRAPRDPSVTPIYDLASPLGTMMHIDDAY